MIITSIAYDFYKSMCTCFIEINGEAQTIFGRPPIDKVIPVVNGLCLFECFCFFWQSIFLIIHVIYKIKKVGERRLFVFCSGSNVYFLWNIFCWYDWIMPLLVLLYGKQNILKEV
jgi:hypothetical protein